MGNRVLIEQLQMVMRDQEARLKDIRQKRREYYGRISELDAEEIDLLVSIDETKKILGRLDEKASKGDSV